MIRVRDCILAAATPLAALALVAVAPVGAGAQTEVLTVQGALPRLNYRDTQGNLLWAMPANSVLWKLDGPFNAGVVVVTAAAKSGSININEGGVSIRGSGFPAAKLHVGTITSVTEPGEVKVDPGNPNAAATIYAVNKDISASMVIETQKSGRKASLRLDSPESSFIHSTGATYTLRDIDNAVNALTVFPSAANDNSIVVRNGRIGLGVINPANPLQLASGAKVTPGGVFTNASSRNLKHDIQPLPATSALETVRALQPVTFEYNADPGEQEVGFIAEDVPALVANNDRKSLSPMDVVAVLTKVVQEQDRQLAAQAEQLRVQGEELAKQRAAIEKITATLGDANTAAPREARRATADRNS